MQGPYSLYDQNYAQDVNYVILSRVTGNNSALTEIKQCDHTVLTENFKTKYVTKL